MRGEPLLEMDGTNHVMIQNRISGLSRIKFFLALSRTPHGILDMASPAFAALLALGGFPPLPVIILGLITAFAGYTSVYALNDVIDYRVDMEKLRREKDRMPAGDLDSLLVRHPMAGGLLSFQEGFLWASAWGVLALFGAYLLNPVCIVIFLAGCALEAIYCRLLKVSWVRTFVSGGVKTAGGIAAVFAVDPAPDPRFLLLLFLTLFLWEIGGQNIPNDWTDMEEDARLGARTIPVRLGIATAGRFIRGSLLGVVLLSAILFHFSGFGLFFVAAAAASGGFLLLLPAVKLFKTPERDQAMALFNKASYFPLALLVLVLLGLIFRG